MNKCVQCESRAPNVKKFSLGGVEVGTCTECNKVIRVSCSEPSNGALKTISMKVEGEKPNDKDSSVKTPCIYMVLSTNEVVDTLREELADVAGVRFRIFVSPSEAMRQFVHDTQRGDARKLVIFHSGIKGYDGTPFIYAVRAVEMGFGSTQVPILVLGDTSTASLERCIQESKNARFVSIGSPPNNVELAKRYLKVIDKLAKR